MKRDYCLSCGGTVEKIDDTWRHRDGDTGAVELVDGEWAPVSGVRMDQVCAIKPVEP